MLLTFLRSYQKKIGILLSYGLTIFSISSCVYHNPEQDQTLEEALLRSDNSIELDDLSYNEEEAPEEEEKNNPALPLGERLGIVQEIPVPEIELQPEEILAAAEAHESQGFQEADFSLDLDQYADYPIVKKWIKYYTTTGRKTLQIHFDRGHFYKPILSKLLRQQGLPGEIYYQALIESGFSPSAVSTAKAVGVWQFISETAKRYGLRIDNYIDERKDPIRSTLAAASYLNDLKNVFNSWLLAMAAYNTGESRVMNLIVRYKTRNYWALSEQTKFPKETANYIPKIVATYIIDKNPKKYGFTTPNTAQMPELIAIALPSPVRIDDVSKLTGIPVSSIKKFNPHLRSNTTPSYLDTYRVWFEKSHTQEELISKLEDLTVLPRESVGPGYYLIRRGDTLAHIAKKFGLSVKTLKLMNGINSNRIVTGTKLLVSSTIKHKDKNGPGYFKYTVKKGDNLFSLAKKYGTSIKYLLQINALKSPSIYVGQKIKIGKI